jgi:aspartyl protease family protein
LATLNGNPSPPVNLMSRELLLMLLADYSEALTRARDLSEREFERLRFNLADKWSCLIGSDEVERIVEVKRFRGHFEVATQVNEAQVRMLFDTGASSIALTQEDAEAAGLSLKTLVYDQIVDTANGRTRAAAVVLDRVAIGSIVRHRVPALVNKRLTTGRLLGMSFLNRLQSYDVFDDLLVLRG